MRDNLLRDDLLRERFARRLAASGVSSADDTAAVLVAARDGLMLHRGLGAGPAAGDAAAILYRLVGGSSDEVT
jgi:hypothetical protein